MAFRLTHLEAAKRRELAKFNSQYGENLTWQAYTNYMDDMAADKARRRNFLNARRFLSVRGMAAR